MRRACIVLVVLALGAPGSLMLALGDTLSTPPASHTGGEEVKPVKAKTDLLEAIKSDLQKNNDDYAEMRRANTTTALPPAHPAAEHALRKAFAMPASPPPAPASHDPKLDRFRQFVLNNKDLLKKFISYKQQLTTAPARPPPPPTPPPGPRVGLDALATTNVYVITTTTPRNKRPGGYYHNLDEDGQHLPDEHVSEEENKRKIEVVEVETSSLSSRHDHYHETDALPVADQLDLSPARGGHIETMRFKGRLCNRNVLMPEGPKYDGKGHVYLHEFSPPRPGMKYSVTRVPILLLPRCCNCCKKSVLGCE